MLHETSIITQTVHQQFLFSTALSDLAILQERNRHISVCRLNCQFIPGERELPLRFLKIHIGPKLTGGENRLGDLRHETLTRARTAEQVRKLVALNSQYAR
jgi:hypothetical protein